MTKQKELSRKQSEIRNEVFKLGLKIFTPKGDVAAQGGVVFPEAIPDEKDPKTPQKE